MNNSIKELTRMPDSAADAIGSKGACLPRGTAISDVVRHIDHYIDGISVPRRERRPFDPVQYMRGGQG